MSSTQSAFPHVNKADIEKYLIQVKDFICKGEFRIEMNTKRADNKRLFDNFVFTEKDAKQFLLSLDAENFSHLLRNEHVGYEHEILYVFGKETELLGKYDEGSKLLKLYIKFNKIDTPYDFLIVISLHIEKHPLNYPFK